MSRKVVMAHEGFGIRGRTVETVFVHPDGGEIPLLLASWKVRLCRERETPLARWKLILASQPRPRISDGEMVYERWLSIPLRWPVHFGWSVNVNPSKAWTGRKRELLYIVWSTPWGRRAVVVTP